MARTTGSAASASRGERRAPGRRGAPPAPVEAPDTAPGRPRGAVALLVARHPVATFLVVALVGGWAVLIIPVLAHRGVIAGGPLPPELFALAVTWVVMLPAALWVTAVSDGRGAVRALLRRLLLWRLGWWWAALVLALPLLAVGVGVVLGGSVDAGADPSGVAAALVMLVTAVLVIHLVEETVWAGFVQTRLERRHGPVVAALLTAVPFSALHAPLVLIGDRALVPALGGLLVLGVAMRLLVGAFLHATGGSLLAAGVVHGVYNACNNSGGVVDVLLTGADPGLAAPIALVLLTTAVAIRVRRHGRSEPARGRVGPTSGRAPTPPPGRGPSGPAARLTGGGRPRPRRRDHTGDPHHRTTEGTLR